MAQTTKQKNTIPGRNHTGYNTVSYINQYKPTREYQSSGGDFLPGYVSTLANPTLENIKENIIVIGFENGKIYFRCNTSDELLTKIATRKNHMKMMAYYKNIVFTQAELAKCWKEDVWMMDDIHKQRAVNGYNEMMKIVYK